MRQRITQLKAEKSRLLDCIDKNLDESLKDHLAAVNKDLATARERLAKCELQLNAQN